LVTLKQPTTIFIFGIRSRRPQRKRAMDSRNGTRPRHKLGKRIKRAALMTVESVDWINTVSLAVACHHTQDSTMLRCLSGHVTQQCKHLSSTDTVMTERSHYWISFLIKQQSFEFCCSDADSSFLFNGAVTEVRRLQTMECGWFVHVYAYRE
jgi:hypothetical protein